MLEWNIIQWSLITKWKEGTGTIMNAYGRHISDCC